MDGSSPAWLHGLVYERARYLRREELYDFVRWNEQRGVAPNESEKDTHAILLIEEPDLMERVRCGHWLKQSSSFSGLNCTKALFV